MAFETPLALAVPFGLGLLAAGYGALRYYDRRLTDPYDAQTTGTVLESSLPEGDAAGPDYAPEVRYEYEVDGTRYENDRIRAAAGPLSRRGARVVLGEYSPESEVVVHYDPDDPDRSVLVRPESGRPWLVLVAAGLAVAAVSLWLWL